MMCKPAFTLCRRAQVKTVLYIFGRVGERYKSISRLRRVAGPPLHQQSRKYRGCLFETKRAFEVASSMNIPSMLPAKVNYAYNVEDMQKMVQEMLNDPELGRHSRVMSVLGVGGRKHSAGRQPDPMPEHPSYGFGYIIKAI